jgi:Spy/CpxP family protein refolding chaperone
MFNEIIVMNTQKLRRLFLCAGLALLGAAMVSAQPNGGGQGQGAGQGQGQGPGKGPGGKQGDGQGANPGEWLQQMVQHLELTPAQIEQMRPIMAANMQEMRTLRQDGALQGKALREKAQALREENRLAVRAILTPEQQAKFDAMPRRGAGGPQDRKQID